MMRKRILNPEASGPSEGAAQWLELERLAEVELTSEDPAHPIEAALRPGAGPGWRAAGPGPQLIRLRFDVPRPLRRVRLVFHEPDVERTQEFTLRWSDDAGGSGEIVRQQYNFSPHGTTREVEEYELELEGVAALELSLVPDVGGGGHRASLAEWRVA